jgi:hypothetical protein
MRVEAFLGHRYHLVKHTLDVETIQTHVHTVRIFHIRVLPFSFTESSLHLLQKESAVLELYNIVHIL